jgi:serine/threonine-protein kinase HipA
VFAVYLHNTRVGLIEQRGLGIRFTYNDLALKSDTIPALSISLPKRPEPYPNRHASPFFRNLLPEQAYRRLVARAANTRVDDHLALLGAIGGECPGAISIWSEDRGPPTDQTYVDLSGDDLAALFRSSQSDALGNAITRGRLSLPGVQEKIALLQRDDGGWMLPQNGAVTSHILKQPTIDFPNLLENEIYCSLLAREAGLEVPETGLATAKTRILCVERFDRVIPSDSTREPRSKVHQEDFCQICRIDPDRKYERDGGPGLAKCADIIKTYSRLPAEDLIRFVRWVGFNYVVGNEDAHGKNLALLYEEDGLRLTPHYDLVSTEVYENLERELAMKIGRSWDIRDVKKSDWRQFATRAGLPWDVVRSQLLELAALVSGSVLRVERLCAGRYGAADVYGTIRNVVVAHAGRLEKEIG